MDATASRPPRAEELDRFRAVRDVEARIAAETNPRHRHMLEVFRDHLAAEAHADVDAVMATLVAEPRFRHFGFAASRTTQEGGAAARAHYAQVLGRPGERHIERIVMDDDHIFADGVNHLVLEAPLVTEVTGAVPPGPPAERYLLTLRVATVVPFENGLMAGEDNYGFWSGPPDEGWLVPL